MPRSEYQCNVCGGTMVGDGYTSPLVCEYVDDYEPREADSNPLYCTLEDLVVETVNQEITKEKAL